MNRLTLELSDDIRDTERELTSSQYEIERLQITGAEYKAYFYHRTALAETLGEQNRRNYNALHQSFCITNDEYLSLEDMYYQGIITKDEYEFCRL